MPPSGFVAFPPLDRSILYLWYMHYYSPPSSSQLAGGQDGGHRVAAGPERDSRPHDHRGGGLLCVRGWGGQTRWQGRWWLRRKAVKIIIRTAGNPFYLILISKQFIMMKNYPMKEMISIQSKPTEKKKIFILNFLTQREMKLECFVSEEESVEDVWDSQLCLPLSRATRPMKSEV